MKKEVLNMKKFFSILLAALMLLAIVPAYRIVAEEEHVEGTQAHNHSVPPDSVVTERDGWAYYNGTYHVFRYRHTGICITCGNIVIMYTKGAYPGTRQEHHDVVISASCNGSLQTRDYVCRPGCYNKRSREIKCPGAPHSDPCGYLPV